MSVMWWVGEFNSFHFSFLLWKSTRSNSQKRKGWSSCVEIPPWADPARRGTDYYSSQPTWLPWLEISIDYGMFRIAANSICTLFAVSRIWSTNLAMIWKSTMMFEWRTSLSNLPAVCRRVPGDHIRQSDMVRNQLAPCYRRDASAWEWRHELHMGDYILYLLWETLSQKDSHHTMSFRQVALLLISGNWSAGISCKVSICIEEIL